MDKTRENFWLLFESSLEGAFPSLWRMSCPGMCHCLWSAALCCDILHLKWFLENEMKAEQGWEGTRQCFHAMFWLSRTLLPSHLEKYLPSWGDIFTAQGMNCCWLTRLRNKQIQVRISGLLLPDSLHGCKLETGFDGQVVRWELPSEKRALNPCLKAEIAVWDEMMWEWQLLLALNRRVGW